MGDVYSRYVLSEKILRCTLGLEQEKDVESPPRPYLLQLSHPPHQPGGDGMQLQEVQAVQRPFQHVDDSGELWDKGRVSPGPTTGAAVGGHQPGPEQVGEPARTSETVYTAY